MGWRPRCAGSSRNEGKLGLVLALLAYECATWACVLRTFRSGSPAFCNKHWLSPNFFFAPHSFFKSFPKLAAPRSRRCKGNYKKKKKKQNAGACEVQVGWGAAEGWNPMTGPSVIHWPPLPSRTGSHSTHPTRDTRTSTMTGATYTTRSPAFRARYPFP